MIGVAVLFLAFCAPDAGEWAPRLEALRVQAERLALVEVAPENEAEKGARLERLKKALDAGVQDAAAFDALYHEIDAVRMWLWASAKERPRRAEGEVYVEAERWRISTPEIDLEVRPADLAMRATAAGETWEFAPCGGSDIIYAQRRVSLPDAGKREATPLITGYSVGLLITLAEFENAPGLAVYLGLHCRGTDLICEWNATELDDTLYEVRWPKRILTAASAAETAVVPRMQGMLVPGDWPQEIRGEGLCNSRELYMPWWGHLRNGAGVLAILETSDDGGAAYVHSATDGTRIEPVWYSSLGKLRYARRIIYSFENGADHVALAKRYRRHVVENGDFVSLAEKRVRTPALDEVIGRPVIHLGALYHFVPEAALFNKDRVEANHASTPFSELAAQLRGLKSRGLEDAYVHLDGWGYYGYDNGHPDVLPPGYEQGGWDGLRQFASTCGEIGYLFAVHDQYRDFYLNAASFDERLVALRQDGTSERNSVWCGGPQAILSPRHAPDYVKRNHDLLKAHGVDVRGAYLDVFSVVPLEESSQPHAPLTRGECAEYRRDCFDALIARGYVVSSEEPAEYLVRTLHLVHHGPYATYPNIGGGDATGIPVPLFNLVYHDSLMLPWEMGNDGGWGIPKGDAGWLHCVLNTGLPYIYPGAGDEEIARVREFAALAGECAAAEMTRHEFLDETRRRQRAAYSNGIVVSVDFEAKTYEVKRPER